MARIRKDKGSKSTINDVSIHAKLKGKKPDKNQNGLSKDQVLALGGDEQDYNLVKDVRDVESDRNIEEDLALSKDVSKFMKGLKLDGPQRNADDSEEPSPLPVEKQTKKKKTLVPTKKVINPAAEVTNTLAPAGASKSYNSKLVVEPTAQWYTSHPPLPSSSTVSSITPAKLASLNTHAASLHASTTTLYQSSSSSSATTTTSDYSFLQKILQSGTLSDRLSALTLLVQSSPVYNVRALDTLKGMAERGKGKGGREESLKALRCVVDWWVGGGVPNRKLKYFRDQPLSNPGVTDQHLLLWYFEDWLKKYFFSILQVLETLSLDPLSYVRTQALSLIFTLLRDKPEQEHNLLRLLVNKLGDTEKSLCSRASYHLLQLVQSHPSMKSIIVREITSLVLRPTGAPSASSSSTHIRFNDATSSASSAPKTKPTSDKAKETNAHARYYATITYNQIVLAPGDREVALQLINVYFEMFKELLGEGKIDEVEADVVDEPEKDDSKGKGKGKDKGGRQEGGRTKGKAKAKEIKGEAGFAEVEDSHSRLISAILTGVNRALPFAKLSSADVGLNKHIDTLFLITHTSTFNISLQALLLIQQISTSLSTSSSTPSSSLTSSITDRYYRTLYASLHDPRLASSSKQAMYLNLLFKSLKVDENKERVKAFVRRFVQVLGSGGGGGTEFIAGGLYLLGELLSTIPGLREMLKPTLKNEDQGEYDPRKREPQFAHASSSPLWELIPLVHHYHPSVSLHARQLLSSEPLTASADLSLNTLSHFLDRFVYKNPKKSSNTNSKGPSIMQPVASGNDGTGVKLMKGEVTGGAGAPVNEEKFWKRRAEDIPVDQLFFHKFFSAKNDRERAKAAKVDKRKDHDDDMLSNSDDELVDDDQEAVSSQESETTEDPEDEDSDAEEAEIWKAMRATMPKAAGDSDLMEDSDVSDGLSSGLEDNEQNEIDSAQDESETNIEDPTAIEDDAEHSDALSLVEGSDNEDLIDLDDDIPQGLIEYDERDAEVADEGEEWHGLEGGQKRKREEVKKDRGRRKKLRSLPTFASYEDYAKLIDEGPEDDI